MTSDTNVIPAHPSSNGSHLKDTTAYYLGFVGLGVATSVFGPTLPALAAQTHTQTGQIGILFAAQSTGYLLGSLQGGHVYDRWKGHPIMVACLVAMAATLALIPLMPMLWSLILIVLLLGLASGTLDVGGNTLLVWLHGKKVGPFINGLHFAFGVGTFVAPLIVAQVALLSDSVAWAYWLLALLILPSAIWLAQLPSPKSRSTYGGVHDANGRLLVPLIAVFFFLAFGAETSYGGWVYTYALKLELASETSAAYLTAAFWGAFTFGRLLAMPLSLRLRPKTLVALDLIAAVLSIIVILADQQSVVGLWVGTMGLGMSAASIVPTTIAIAERRLPLTGRITSWFFVGGAAGSITLPWLTGQLLARSGGRAVMVAIAAMLSLIVIVFIAIAAVPVTKDCR